MAFVLCAGVIESLVRTRKLVLEHAGHTVVGVLSGPEIVRACQQAHFDVAVIGRSCDRSEKREYLDLIRKHCGSTRVLEMYTSSQGKVLPDADDWLEGSGMPMRLVESVHKLAGQK